MKYTEFTSEAASGSLKTVVGPHDMITYHNTSIFQAYESSVIPGILQIPEYRRSLAQFWDEFLGTDTTPEEAVAVTEARKGLLEDESHQFVFVIDEQVLHRRLSDSVVMEGQIDFLYKTSERPNVSIGIIPQNRPRNLIPSAGFWIFDRTKVAVEIPNASIEITDAAQVYLYLDMFSKLASLANYDPDAW